MMVKPDMITLSQRALSRMLPMHLWLAPDGTACSVGSTLEKLVPDLKDSWHTRLHDARGAGASGTVFDAICRAARAQTRLFLRVEGMPDLVLRGHAAMVEDGSVLVNLGFGITLYRAVAAAGLTDADFAPTDLAIELLFLHEANMAVRTELARFTEQLERDRQVALAQAHTDPLTGLANRRGLELALSALLPAARDDPAAPPPEPFAIVHLDLDRFKEVNDRLGHKAGDELLREVGQVLRHALRRDDTAARTGGDEFVFILRGETAPAHLDHLARRIIASIERCGPSGAVAVPVSASLGIAIWHPGCITDPGAILELTDVALYRSKHAGRGCATIINCPPEAQEAAWSEC